MTFRPGDFVRYKDGDETVIAKVVGESSGKDKTKLSVQPLDKKFKPEGSPQDKAISDLSRAGVGNYLSRTGGDQAIEIAVNTAFYSAVQALFRKHKAFGHETMSFLASDALYELLVKYYLTDFVSMLVPTPVASGGGWFEMGDAHDAAAKTIPVVIIQQIVCKFAYRHKFGAGLLRQAVDSFAAISLGNICGRNITRRSDEGKSVPYNW